MLFTSSMADLIKLWPVHCQNVHNFIMKLPHSRPGVVNLCTIMGTFEIFRHFHGCTLHKHTESHMWMDIDLYLQTVSSAKSNKVL